MTRARRRLKRVSALTGCLTLALAGASLGEVGDGEHTQPVTYNVEGKSRGGQKVKVTGGNYHVEKAHLVGETVRFEMTLAPIDVRDVNDDGYEDFRDFQSGDRLFVKTELPKNRPGKPPYPVRFVVNRTNPRPR